MQISDSLAWKTYFAMVWYLNGTKTTMAALLPSITFCWIAGMTSLSGIGGTGRAEASQRSDFEFAAEHPEFQPLKSARVRIGRVVA